MKQPGQVKAAIHNNRGRYISWLLIAALSGCCLYLFLSRNKIVSDNDIILKQKQLTIDSVKTDRVYLQADFDAASARIDQLMSRNLTLKDSLQDNKIAIAELQSQIKSILSDKESSQADLMKARNMLYMLISKAQAYELYIAELEKDNSTLTSENKLLSDERDETVAKNIALKMAGRVLQPSNIRIEPVHKRSDGKEKEKSETKKVDKLRITFDITQNRIAESGTKQIYIRIIGPDNKVLYSDNISGTMNTVKMQGIQYSILKEVDYIKNHSIQNVVAEWLQPDTYIKGTYIIELYNEGYKVGHGSVKLK